MDDDQHLERTRSIIESIASGIERNAEQGLNDLRAIAEGRGDVTPAAIELAKRAFDMILVAAAYERAKAGANEMPWRAGYGPQDSAWCEEVIVAIKDKKARPAHPDAVMERIISGAILHMRKRGHL